MQDGSRNCLRRTSSATAVSSTCSREDARKRLSFEPPPLDTGVLGVLGVLEAVEGGNFASFEITGEGMCSW